MNVKIEGTTVTIIFTLQPPRPSSTGKTDIVYTTGGFSVLAPGSDLKINMTVVKSKK